MGDEIFVPPEISFNLMVSVTLEISKSSPVQFTVLSTLYYTAPPRRPVQHFQPQTLLLLEPVSLVSCLTERPRTLSLAPRILFLPSLCQTVPKFCQCLLLRAFCTVFSLPSPLPSPQHLWAPCLQVFSLSSLCLSEQDSEKLGKFLGKWNGETETRKLNKAKQFEQLTGSL